MPVRHLLFTQHIRAALTSTSLSQHTGVLLNRLYFTYISHRLYSTYISHRLYLTYILVSPNTQEQY